MSRQTVGRVVIGHVVRYVSDDNTINRNVISPDVPHTRKLYYCKDDCTMCLVYECPEIFLDSL